jgi:hypothetical protein
MVQCVQQNVQRPVTTATAETTNFNASHAPLQNAVEAFTIVLPEIKRAVIHSRHDWNKHEPKMWSRAGK